jgi:glycosyltransferase involved in cell wall biosynthesis
MKLLVLSPFPPRLDASHGGARTIAGLVTRLAGAHRIALMTLRALDEPPVDSVVADACELVIEVERRVARASLANTWRERQRLPMVLRAAPGWSIGFSVREFGAELERVVEEWEPDVVQIEFVVMAQYLSRVGDRPVVVVDHDPSDGMRRMRRLRVEALRRAAAVVVFTERDRATLRNLDPALRVERIPIAVDLPPAPLDALGNGRDVLFVGSFEHPPNVEAAVRLVRRIFPRIATARPDARLLLVGPDPPSELRAAADGSVLVTGRVEDVRPLLDAAAVVVAPLTRGGGMRVKVLDALAAGKALVASPPALAGVEVEPGVHAMVEEDDDAFARAVVALLEDEGRRRAIGAAARAWAEEHLDWWPAIAAYNALYASVVGKVVQA